MPMKNLRSVISTVIVWLSAVTVLHGQGATTHQSLRVIHPSDPSKSIMFQPPSSITSYSLTWPGAQGAASSVMLNDGNGLLSWTTAASLVTNTAWSLTGNTLTDSTTQFLGSANAFPVILRSNNTERMRITSSGNIGIGTSSPVRRLHIDGGANPLLITSTDFRSIELSRVSGMTGIEFSNTVGSPSAGIYGGSAAVAVNTNGSERIRITAGGNVGIGTDAPTEKLDVNGSIRFASSGIVGPTNLNITTDTWQEYYYGLSRNSQLSARFNGMKVYNNANGHLGVPASRIGFFTDRTGLVASTERMTITEDGNIGVGTTTPSTLLDVAGTFRATGASTIGSTLTLSSTASAAAADSVLMINSSNQVTKTTRAALLAGANAWTLSGNSGTTNGGTLGAAPTGNFVGTTGTAASARDLSFVTNNVIQAQISTAGVLSTQNDVVANGVNVGRGASGISTNSVVGANGLAANTTGIHNSALGSTALRFNTTGSSNSAVGMSALFTNTTGYDNSAVGMSALYSNQTGYQSSAFGKQALYLNTTGYSNSAVGMSALYSNTTGNNNSAVGMQALYSNATGDNNTAVGTRALYHNTAGSSTALGFEAGRHINAGTPLNSVSNSVFLGNDTRALADGDANTIVIGAGARGLGSNTAVLGNSSIAATRLQGRVGVGADPTTATGDAQVQITPAAAANEGLLIKGASGQTADLLDLQNNAGTTQFRVGPSGATTIGGTLTLSSTASAAVADSVLMINSSNQVTKTTRAALLAASGWALTGNTLADSTTQFLGSANAFPVILRSNNTERMRIDAAGNVGIGTTSPAERLDVTGDLRLTNFRTRSMTRSIPTVINDAVDLGTFSFGNGSSALWIAVTVNQPSFAVTKQYLLPTAFNITGGAWWLVQPLSSTAAYGGNDFEIDASVTNGTVSLRLRRTGGSSDRIAHILIKEEGINTSTFTPSTAVNSVAAPSVIFPATPLRQVSGRVGINTIAPVSTLDVTGTLGVSGASTIGGALTLSSTASAAAADSVLMINSSNQVTKTTRAALTAASSWALTGNSLTDSTTQFLGSANAFPVILRSNNTERMRITSAGNVGIGVINPLTRFDSRGTILVSTNITGNNILAFGNSASYGPLNGAPDGSHGSSFIVGNSTNDPGAASNLSFWTTVGGNVNERVRITSAGNVGIGDASPAALLTVGSGDLFQVNSSGAIAAVTGITTTGGYTQSGAGVNTLSGATTVGGTLTLSSAASAAATDSVLMINSSNQVTKTTRAALVAGTGWALTGNASTNPTNNFIGTTDNVDFTIRTANVEQLRVTSSGNVGIGVSAPSAKLDVAGDVRANGEGVYMGADAGASRLGFVKKAGSSPVFAAGSGTSLMFGHWSTADIRGNVSAGTFTERLRINASGNVGVGTTAPSAKLDVVGDIVAHSEDTYIGVDAPGNSRLGLVKKTGLSPVIAAGSGSPVSFGNWSTVNLLGNVSTGTYTENMRITSSGNVGIGDATPVAMLTVGNGDLFQVNSSGAIAAVTGITTTGGYTQSGASVNTLSGATTIGGTLTLSSTASAATTDSVLMINSSNQVTKTTRAALFAGTGWALAGNSITDASTQFLGTTSNQPLVIRTNNTERMRITSAGNVGIGTNNPSGLLHLEGGSGATGVQLYVSTTAGYTGPAAGNAAFPGGAKIVLWNDAATPQRASIGMDPNADIWFNNAGGQAGSGFTFYTGNGASAAPAARLKIAKDGNVGIGTTSPSSLLSVGSTSQFQVNSSGAIAAVTGITTSGGYTQSGAGVNTLSGATIIGSTLTLSSTASAAAADSVLMINSSNQVTKTTRAALFAGTGWALAGNSITDASTQFLGTTSNQPLVIRTNNTERIRITSAGLVGIGTANPSVPLTMQTPTTGSVVDMLRFQVASNASGSGQRISWFSDVQNAYIDGVRDTDAGPTMSLRFGVGVGEVMRMNVGGNVGIGTTSPATRLDVSGGLRVVGDPSSTGLGANLLIDGSPNAIASLLFRQNAGDVHRGFIRIDATSVNNVQMEFGTANTTRMVIGGAALGGNVGIGTTTPSTLLDVAGTFRATGASTIGGTLTLSSTASAAAADSVLMVNSSNQVTKTTRAALFAASGWSLTGNAGTSASSNFIGTTDAVDFVARTNGTERMRITSGGVVGIGTDNPTQGYAGTIANVKLALRSGAVGAEYGSSVLLLGGNDNHYSSIAGVHTQFGNTYLAFGTSAAVSNPTERMRITSAGNVGIGDTTPVAMLTVGNGDLFQVNSSGAIAAVTGITTSGGYTQSGAGVNTLSGATTIGGTLTLSSAASAAAADSVLMINSSNQVTKTTRAELFAASGWSLTGNTLADSTTQFLGSANAFPVILRSNNTERMRITSSGNVGIGTNNPGAPLQVGNYTQLTNDNTNEFAVLTAKTAVGGGQRVFVSATDFRLGTSVTAPTLYTASGNVGIGTTTPQSRLDIAVGSTAAPTYKGAVRVLGGSETAEGGLEIQNSPFASGYGWRIFGPDFGSGNVPLVVASRNNSAMWTERIRVTSDGKVGIGTTTPADRLEINNGGILAGNAVNNFRIKVSRTGANPSLLTIGAFTDSPAIEYDGAFGLRFLSGESGTEVMKITTAGNLGIGTTTPSTLLDVAGTFRATGASTIGGTLTLSSTASAAAADSVLMINSSNQVTKTTRAALFAGTGWALAGNSITDASTQFLGTTSNQPLVIRTNNTEKVRVTTDGKVGIGTAGPEALLHVLPTAGSPTSGSAFLVGVRPGFGNSSADRYGHVNFGDLNTVGNPSVVSISSKQVSTGSNLYTDKTGNIAELRFIGTGTDGSTGSQAASVIASTGTPGFGNAFTNLANLDFTVRGPGATDGVASPIRMRITGDGNVGIGTTTPFGRLSVVSTTGTGASVFGWSTGYSVFGPNAGSANGAALALAYNTTSDRAEILSLAPSVSWKPLSLYSAGLDVRSQSSETITATFTTSGNVGIGDATPVAMLTVGNGDLFQVNSSGAIAAATGITAAGTIALNTTGTAATTIGNTTAATAVTIASGTTGRLALTGLPTVTATTGENVLVINASNQVSRITPANLVAGNAWALTGNTGTSASTNFIGTTDAVDFVARTNNTERMRITSAGNVGIGTTTPGSALQVNGNVLFRGTGNTSATNALIIQNVDGTVGFRVQDNGVIAGNDYIPVTSTSGLNIYGGNGAISAIRLRHLSINTHTSGERNTVLVQDIFEPTSGNGTLGMILINPTINQTGGAIGTTRGLYINPVLTAAFDWRSIQWTNNSGYGLFGSGTANNYLAGNLGIGTMTPSSLLSVGSTSQFQVNSSGAIAAVTGITTSGGYTQSGAGVNTLSGATTVGGTLTLSSAASAAATDSVLMINSSNQVTKTTRAALLAGASGWGLTGNALTDSTTQFLGATNAFPLVMRTNNTERMRITSSGFVGIGTTTPGALLEVVSSNTDLGYGVGEQALVLRNNGTVSDRRGAGIRFVYGTSVNASAQIDLVNGSSNQAGSLAFGTRGGTGTISERMRVTSDGNVGIGTTTPDSRLTITGSGSNSIGVMQINPTGADSWSYASSSINSALPVNGTVLHIMGRALSAYNAGYVGFNYVGSGSTSNFLSLGHHSSPHLLNVLANGNIGIGTTTPNAQLQLGQTTANRKIVMFEVANNDHQFFGQGIASNTFRLQIPGVNDRYTFNVGLSSTQSSEIMRIQGDGNVGIGTGAPAARLHVTNTLATTNTTVPVMRLDGQSSGNPAVGLGTGLEFATATTSANTEIGSVIESVTTNVGNNTEAFDLVFRTMAGGATAAERMRISSAGNVTATAFFESSDARLKDVIRRDGDVVYYKWKDGRDDKIHIGYLAQEVQTTHPDQVNTDAKGMMSVHYIELLVEKIRQLEKRVEELEQQRK